LFHVVMCNGACYLRCIIAAFPYGYFKRSRAGDGVEAAGPSDAIAGPAPLEITVRECCNYTAEVTGAITHYDVKQNGVLVVNEQKKNGNTDDPEATWIRLEEDALLIIDGSKSGLGLNESLVGREAKAWTNGFIAQSYPGQTSAIKMIVE